jgi:8-oxo-dGTP pyrophosphatase MutT (NUDIX family)
MRASPSMPEYYPVNHTLTSLKTTLRSKHLSGAEDAVDAVVALLLHANGSDLDLLLIHRAERTNDPWSGQIGLPGGRVARSDSSTRSALRREVIEEIGVDLNEKSEELGTLSIGSPMRRLDMKVQPWVYRLTNRPEIITGPEVQESFWVSVFKLPSLRTSAEIEIRGIRREVDAFLIDGRVVWGYTHRVLNELLSVLDSDN